MSQRSSSELLASAAAGAADGSSAASSSAIMTSANQMCGPNSCSAGAHYPLSGVSSRSMLLGSNSATLVSSCLSWYSSHQIELDVRHLRILNTGFAGSVSHLGACELDQLGKMSPDWRIAKVTRCHPVLNLHLHTVQIRAQLCRLLQLQPRQLSKALHLANAGNAALFAGLVNIIAHANDLRQ
eukprot:6174200-Pleurochrysis_carterae.AAC.4